MYKFLSISNQTCLTFTDSPKHGYGIYFNDDNIFNRVVHCVEKEQ